MSMSLHYPDGTLLHGHDASMQCSLALSQSASEVHAVPVLFDACTHEVLGIPHMHAPLCVFFHVYLYVCLCVHV